MKHSGRPLAVFLPEPVLLARSRCDVCHGDGHVPTPEFAGWSATVERLKEDHLAEYGGNEQLAYEKARDRAGPAPEQTKAPCKGCDGRGYNEIELGLDRLADLLSDAK